MPALEPKVPCSYSWLDEYTEPSAVQVSWDGDLGVISIDGSGDGTLELIFYREDFSRLLDQMHTAEWNLYPELQETPEEG